MNLLKIVNDSDFTVPQKQLLTFTPFSGMIRSNNKNNIMIKIIIALDYINRSDILKFSDDVYEYVDGFKINHALLDFSGTIAGHKELFIDCKLWDTPNTMKNVVEILIEKGATMTTICTHNNDAVFKELEQYRNDIKLLGVTYLTSWTPQDQHQICKQMPLEMWREHLRRIEGFYGMICSPEDVRSIDFIDFQNLFKRVCPGITYGNNNSGQVRTTTPKEAQDFGADYIVIGRAVTTSENPIETLKEIRETLFRSPIAQLVEQSTVNALVAGSSPARGAKPL